MAIIGCLTDEELGGEQDGQDAEDVAVVELALRIQALVAVDDVEGPDGGGQGVQLVAEAHVAKVKDHVGKLHDDDEQDQGHDVRRREVLQQLPRDGLGVRVRHVQPDHLEAGVQDAQDSGDQDREDHPVRFAFKVGEVVVDFEVEHSNHLKIIANENHFNCTDLSLPERFSRSIAVRRMATQKSGPAPRCLR